MAISRGDTIVALASGSGKSSVMVFRISGSKTQAVVKAIAGKLPQPKTIQLSLLRDQKGGLLDEALVLFFEKPHSYTGEDMAEFQCHGSRAVKSAILKCMAEYGVRVAVAGEFTERAFLNGKMNLVEAMGINDLAMAETEQQRKTALAQWLAKENSLSQWLQVKRDELVKIKAIADAMIDFGEEDLSQAVFLEYRKILSEWIVAVKKMVDDERIEKRVAGLKIAIVGAPNVGKSSLMNLLAQREVSIVSEQAGTTRDVIELHLDLFGYEVTIYDMAGLRRAKNKIEKLGIEKAEQLAEICDVRIFVKDIFLGEKNQLPLNKRKGDIVLANKCDAITDDDLKKQLQKYLTKDDIMFSTKTEQGLDKLMRRLKIQIEKLAGGDIHGFTHEYQRSAMRRALFHAEQAYLHTNGELASEEISLAMQPLDETLGQTTSEQVLGLIFRQFCVGK